MSLSLVINCAAVADTSSAGVGAFSLATLPILDSIILFSIHRKPRKARRQRQWGQRHKRIWRIERDAMIYAESSYLQQGRLLTHGHYLSDHLPQKQRVGCVRSRCLRDSSEVAAGIVVKIVAKGSTRLNRQVSK